MRDFDLELSIELLENRQMLAGEVFAEVTAGGDLFVTGDDSSNQIRIYRDAELGIVVDGEAGTLVNGRGYASFGGVRAVTDDVIIKLNDGFDVVEVGDRGKRLNLPDDLVIDAGDGDDEIDLAVDVDNLRVKTGRGNDDFRIFSDSGEETIIGGKAIIKTADGNDQVRISNIEFDNRISVLTGAGNDRVDYSDYNTSQAGLDGHLKIATGAGVDNVIASNGLSLSRLTLQMGGDDDITSLGSRIDQLLVIGGGGYDAVFNQGFYGDESPVYRSIEQYIFP